MERIESKQRDKTLDAIKLFAIFLVLWGHAIQYFLSSKYYDEPVYRFIYSFHMPLFMMLVGYFSTNLIKLSLQQVIRKKFQQLLLPAISFSVLYLGVKWVLKDIDSSGVFNGFIWGFWFLKSAFLCCVLYYTINRMLDKLRISQWFSYLISVLIVIMGLRLLSMLFPNLPQYEVMRMYPCYMVGIALFSYLPKIRANYIYIYSYDNKCDCFWNLIHMVGCQCVDGNGRLACCDISCNYRSIR